MSNDWKTKSDKIKDVANKDLDTDLICCAIIMSSMIKSGSSPTAVPRAAVLAYIELKKEYEKNSLENLGS